MNRPVWNLHVWDNYEDYVNLLEKYCDELEQSNKSLSNAYDDCLATLHFWEEEYHIYRKALDKACELLEDCPLSALDKELDCNNCTDDYAKCWKEWALKDE